jgi:hypothetical protein
MIQDKTKHTGKNWNFVDRKIYRQIMPSVDINIMPLSNDWNNVERCLASNWFFRNF